MTYYHWAREPVKLRRMDYVQSGFPKPNGLWFDADEDWKRWCESTDYELENLRYRHTVTVIDESRILCLKNARAIDTFTGKYRLSLSSGIQFLQSENERETFTNRYGRDIFSEIQAQFSNSISWPEVAAKYSGIVIVPFSRARSSTYLWYYGWYCASGCVWDTSVIRLGKPHKMLR